ncbi:ABC transporter ATP-binding protein [Parasphaerochaeta coccoides]|uniref:Xenobiotic-transporting ATPase n=1 Tax=Parasphaerochaeta coccoides (strain ATCC BAA-1237 / DSM 17374 / SPN1) TaxID=760011 RepID=F4GM05_PARC1|nr:ABC transporter ATP-binding protein [Parasphaerochaeta coccoides]AEC02480.1 Xenobiotic-transporting ATPase [Parasphaerochaeta coccoides DSM 17374]
MKSAPRKQSVRRTASRLWHYVAPHIWLVIIAVILTLGSNLLALAGPLLSGYAVDAMAVGTGRVDFPAVIHNCTLMVVLYASSSLLSYILSRVMIRLGQKMVYAMRRDIFDKLTRLPVGFFDRNSAGDIISRVTYDIDTINTSLVTDSIQILTSIVTVAGSLFMMFTISPTMVLVFAVTVPLSMVVTRFLARRGQPLFRARSSTLGRLNGFSEEMISARRTIAAYHREATMVSRFDGYNDAAIDAYYRADAYSSTVGPTVNLFNNLSLSLISVFGALLFLAGRITLGNMSSFVLYSRKFSGPINEAANLLSEFQSAFAAAERVFRLLDETDEIADVPDAHVFHDVDGHVEARHVNFGYMPEKVILHDLNLDVPPGRLVAIVGPTGAGKTTLINLLMRFYDPLSGTMCLDGIDISLATRASLRSSYAMVLQDAWLFYGTIYENLAYGKPGATMDDVVAVAKVAKVHDYIMSLPHGYDTILNEDTLNISQGQKQLLTIARAMLLDARMLILDEATSNVDTRTERTIQEAMRSLMQGKTSFVIAHRLSTIMHADEIVVVQNGEVVEKGTHASLMAHDGLYSTLYYSQFTAS